MSSLRGLPYRISLKIVGEKCKRRDLNVTGYHSKLWTRTLSLKLIYGTINKLRDNLLKEKKNKGKVQGFSKFNLGGTPVAREDQPCSYACFSLYRQGFLFGKTPNRIELGGHLLGGVVLITLSFNLEKNGWSNWWLRNVVNTTGWPWSTWLEITNSCQPNSNHQHHHGTHHGLAMGKLPQIRM